MTEGEEQHYAGHMCKECTHRVGHVGRHEKLCSVHWLKAKLLGVFGLD